MPTFRNGLCRIGKVYHYCFRIHGQQFKGSTRATDKPTAEKVLADKRREALLGPQEPVCPIPTLEALTRDWLAAHRGTHTHHHLNNVEHLSRNWVLPALGELPLHKVSTQAVLELRRKVLDAGKSFSTANHVLQVVKLLLNYGVRLGHLEKLPFKVKMLKLQRAPRATVPSEQMAAFLHEVDKAARNPQVGTIVRLMAGLGLREAEALGARWAWLDAEQRTYVVGRTKNRLDRTIPVPEWLWAHLQTMPKTLNEYICPARDGKPHRCQFTKKAMAKACIELHLKGITPHSLRRTFATQHAQISTPLTDLQAMLGHATPMMTTQYIQQSLDSKRRAQDALSLKLGLA